MVWGLLRKSFYCRWSLFSLLCPHSLTACSSGTAKSAINHKSYSQELVGCMFIFYLRDSALLWTMSFTQSNNALQRLYILTLRPGGSNYSWPLYFGILEHINAKAAMQLLCKKCLDLLCWFTRAWVYEDTLTDFYLTYICLMSSVWMHVSFLKCHQPVHTGKCTFCSLLEAWMIMIQAVQSWLNSCNVQSAPPGEADSLNFLMLL